MLQGADHTTLGVVAQEVVEMDKAYPACPSLN